MCKGTQNLTTLTSIDYWECKVFFVMASLVPCLIRPPIPKVHLKVRHMGITFKKKLWFYVMHFFFFLLFLE